jgi:RNA polymerase-interacting CarD/CdnL/TRCF family regulator
MRTNVNIADDAREFAEDYASANDISLGEAITELIRKSRRKACGDSERQHFARAESGFPIFPRSGRTITTEMVLEAQANDLD